MKWKNFDTEWLYRGALTAITIYIISFIACSCNGKRIDYRYRIEGRVRTSVKAEDTTWHSAIWVTDTFRVSNDTIIITNSDSSKWRIAPPYSIHNIKTETLVRVVQ